MRYGIFSDVHSNLEAFAAVINAYKEEDIDQHLCVGDVVGYAVNPRECIDRLEEIAQVTVAGNHDWATVDLFSIDNFNHFAKEAIFWTKQNLDDRCRYFLKSLKLVYKNGDLTLVHAMLDNPGDFDYLTDTYTAGETFRLLETNICFIGHTHVAGIFIQDKQGQIYYQEDNLIAVDDENKYIINVGSVGQPRDRNPYACYSIYDTSKKEVQIKRISYNNQTTRKKILAEGLPAFLGDRLLIGK